LKAAQSAIKDQSMREVLDRAEEFNRQDRQDLALLSTLVAVLLSIDKRLECIQDTLSERWEG
jgi:hypothetical protein